MMMALKSYQSLAAFSREYFLKVILSFDENHVGHEGTICIFIDVDIPTSSSIKPGNYWNSVIF
jgi:hypothetical protein